ncbi:hypothetical protein [Streptacidiphilus melanogenes]|uniref:hypothetical protein n=1 Tax=Streptacidiphilus melanogenes TaxID=411235 RepID=UPI001364CB0F|nr:hypothetical protein [Streptacidiphilus melanogenes]
MPTSLVVGVQQHPSKGVDAAAGPSDVARDGGGDPVTVLSSSLPMVSQGDRAVPCRPAVGADGIPAGEVAQQDQVCVGDGFVSPVDDSLQQHWETWWMPKGSG